MSASAAAITGLGCVSALGTGAAATWSGLIAGRAGIRHIEQFSSDGLRNTSAGCVALSPPLEALRQRRGVKGRLELFAAWAIAEALADAGWSVEDLGGKRAALIAGTSLGMSLVTPTFDARPPEPYSEAACGADFAELGRDLGAMLNLEDETLLVSTACASGTHAIGLARGLIAECGYDLVVAGGADSLDRMKYLGHTALATLTESLPRPFSRRRDGTLFGEGAAFLVLERAGLGRPGRVYARCAGAGYSTDIHHITAPDPAGRGAAAAMSSALRDAGLAPGDIDHVNLHGSGTSLNDDAEALALATVFGAGAPRLASTSIKPAIGHAMGAAGAIEAVATVLAVHGGLVPPTLNVEADEVAFDIGLVRGAALRRPIRAALSNSFGFGGANGVVAFTAAEGGERRPEGSEP